MSLSDENDDESELTDYPSSHNGENQSKLSKRKQRQQEMRAAKAKRGGLSSEASMGPSVEMATSSLVSCTRD